MRLTGFSRRNPRTHPRQRESRVCNIRLKPRLSISNTHVSLLELDLIVKLPPLRLLSSKPVKVQPFLTDTDSMSFLYQ